MLQKYWKYLKNIEHYYCKKKAKGSLEFCHSSIHVFSSLSYPSLRSLPSLLPCPFPFLFHQLVCSAVLGLHCKSNILLATTRDSPLATCHSTDSLSLSLPSTPLQAPQKQQQQQPQRRQQQIAIMTMMTSTTTATITRTRTKLRLQTTTTTTTTKGPRQSRQRSSSRRHKELEEKKKRDSSSGRRRTWRLPGRGQVKSVQHKRHNREIPSDALTAKGICLLLLPCPASPTCPSLLLPPSGHRRPRLTTGPVCRRMSF